MAKNQVISIDIGTDAIKMVQLEKTADGIRLIDARIESYPDRQGETVEHQAVNVNNVTESLLKVWKKVGRKYPVVVSVPRLLITTRRLPNLPQTNEDEQLTAMVAMQAETELPFRPEDAVYDFHDIRQIENGVSVEIVAAKRDAVQGLIDCLKPLNVIPSFMLPSAFGTAVLAGQQLEKTQPDQLTMIADIGAGRTDLCVVRGNYLEFSRSFPFGGDQLTDLYRSNDETSFSEAEAHKIQQAGLDDQSESPVDEWAERLVTELDRSISAVQKTIGVEGNQVAEILLSGGSSRIPGLTDYISGRLGIPTQIWRLSETWQYVDSTAALDVDLDDRLAVALGQGINSLTGHIGLDLLPKEEKAKISKADQQRRLVASAAAGIILVVGLGIGITTWGGSQKAKINEIDQQIRQLRPAESKAKKDLTRELAIANLLAPRLSSLDILREFSTRFADRTKVALTTFSLTRLDEPDKAKITFNVEANSHQNISQLISAMKQSGLFQGIKQGQVTAAERSRRSIFQVQITCNLAPNAIQMFTESRYINPTLVINPSAGTVEDDDENASSQFQQDRGEEWRRSSENQEWEDEDEDGDEDVETSKSSFESESSKKRSEDSGSGNKRDRELDEGKGSESSEKEEWSDRDDYAKYVLPSKEEYDQMSPDEQGEVREAKGAIYGTGDSGDGRSDDATSDSKEE